MQYVIEMGSGAMIYISYFIKTGSGKGGYTDSMVIS
jgi:hypothetical protein